MSLTLQMRIGDGIDAETRIQEISLLTTLFGDMYPKQRYRRDGITGKVSYILEAQFEEFPVSPEQRDYLEHRDFTLTGTPSIACAICTPETKPLLTVKEVKEGA